ncbi:LytTR family DNA-binding domain-containing protein [Limibacter armeniacum]|uniref:LytR/AlgR family response regulator transcription factor n=1 Tax=Limibacter armeniacum TaxID=466084 RepID=UPI002FE5876F
MNVAIIEDEPLAAQKLQQLLLDQDQNIKVVAVLDSVEKAINWLEENEHPDLLFADIQIADGLSFQVFNEVELNCPVIFTTAYDQYAINAFEVNSLDYLLKPVRAKRLANSLQKFKQMRQWFERSPEKEKLDELINMMQHRDDEYKSRFLVKNGSKIQAIKCQSIAYFYTKDRVNVLVTKSGDIYPVDYTLDELSNLLNPKLFFRVNRKFIIHLDAAFAIHTYFKGRLKLELTPAIDEDVVVSSERTPLFKEWLDQ